jgi:hypothetical protein
MLKGGGSHLPAPSVVCLCRSKVRSRSYHRTPQMITNQHIRIYKSHKPSPYIPKNTHVHIQVFHTSYNESHHIKTLLFILNVGHPWMS